MNYFLNQIPVFAIKGFILFLGAGIIFALLHWLGITIYMDHIYPKIMSVGIEIRILVIFIVGVIAQYTFWDE